MGTSYINFVNEAKSMYRSNIFDTHLAKVINFVCIHVLHFGNSVTLLFFYDLSIHTLEHNGYAAKYTVPMHSYQQVPLYNLYREANSTLNSYI